MKMKGIIHVDHLSFSYGKVNVFSDFSLSVNEGEFVSIVGCNKSGKTTLMKLLAGLLPSNGKISVNYVIADSKNIDYTAPTVGGAIRGIRRSVFYSMMSIMNLLFH